MSAKLADLPLLGLIHEYLEHLEVERNLSSLTIRDYQLYLLRFQQWAQQYGLNKITDLDLTSVKKYRLHLARLTDSQARTLSVRTQAYYIIALRSFLKWLVKQDVPVLAPEKID